MNTEERLLLSVKFLHDGRKTTLLFNFVYMMAAKYFHT